MQTRDWADCPLISMDPETRSGEPVFKGTRLPVENVITSVYAYQELEGMKEDDAISATLESFPTTPGGADAIRQVLAYIESRQLQLAP